MLVGAIAILNKPGLKRFDVPFPDQHYAKHMVHVWDSLTVASCSRSHARFCIAFVRASLQKRREKKDCIYSPALFLANKM